MTSSSGPKYPGGGRRPGAEPPLDKDSDLRSGAEPPLDKDSDLWSGAEPPLDKDSDLWSGAEPPLDKKTDLWSGTERPLPILILAAGASKRMRGGDKLLEDINGQTCLELMTQRAIATAHPVFVTLPHFDHARARCLHALNITPVAVPDASIGLSRSLQRGAAALPQNAKAMMILPADMPEITTKDMLELIAAYHSDPCDALQACTEDGKPGHPSILSQSIVAQFETLTGDKGAARLIKASRNTRLHPLDGTRARLDLDTPENWAAWRATICQGVD